jgi:hypothetical protein
LNLYSEKILFVHSVINEAVARSSQPFGQSGRIIPILFCHSQLSTTVEQRLSGGCQSAANGRAGINLKFHLHVRLQ